MKKLLLSVVTLAVVLGSANPSFAAVKNEKNYEVNSLDQFLENVHSKKETKAFKSKKAKLQGKHAITEEEKILLESTDPKVIEEYADLLEKELKNFKISETKADGVTEYVLGESGATITVETETESLSKDDLVSTMETESLIKDDLVSTMATQYRPYGSYSYSIKYHITAYAYPDSIAGLVTNYSVKADGLRLTSASNAGTLSIFPTTVVAGYSITDSRAELGGYDINAQGDYNVTIGGYNGIGLISFDMTIISRILWSATGSVGLTVNETYSQSGDKSP